MNSFAIKEKKKVTHFVPFFLNDYLSMNILEAGQKPLTQSPRKKALQVSYCV